MSAEHYFTPEPGAAERAATVEFSAGGRNLTLRTSSGVFSGQRLDPGTAANREHHSAGGYPDSVSSIIGTETCQPIERSETASTFELDSADELSPKRFASVRFKVSQ